jgi:hypothetical protein
VSDLTMTTAAEALETARARQVELEQTLAAGAAVAVEDWATADDRVRLAERQVEIARQLEAEQTVEDRRRQAATICRSLASGRAAKQQAEASAAWREAVDALTRFAKLQQDLDASLRADLRRLWLLATEEAGHAPAYGHLDAGLPDGWQVSASGLGTFEARGEGSRWTASHDSVSTAVLAATVTAAKRAGVRVKLGAVPPALDRVAQELGTT